MMIHLRCNGYLPGVERWKVFEREGSVVSKAGPRAREREVLGMSSGLS